CQPCRQGCATCEDDAPCLIQEDRALRAAVLSCQACCMLAVFLSMLISYHFRHSKARPPQRIRASGVILLETILFGSLLLYFPVFILYFKPSIFRCIVLRWVRMLGFAIVYGTITLKLYRRWVPVAVPEDAPHPAPGGRLWAGSPRQGGPIGQQCPPCSSAPIGGTVDKVPRGAGRRAGVLSVAPRLSPAAEMLFLLWGSFLCFATRAVPSAFHEPRYMGIALHNELMISAAFHVVMLPLRGVGVGGGVSPAFWGPLGDLAPSSHTHPPTPHPQFLHAGSPLREEIAAEVYEEELDMRRSGSCLNSSIASAWSEHSLDPDDIREELKKIYRQLEVHKTRRMAANNPHLPKKRSSRRSLGRSIVRR
ncbi:GP158 protein, partial [Rostratula benghalensis]|nr:GP158 protein [Rostratula benghalensis]